MQTGKGWEHKGTSIYNVSNIFGFFDTLPHHPHFCIWSVLFVHKIKQNKCSQMSSHFLERSDSYYPSTTFCTHLPSKTNAHVFHCQAGDWNWTRRKEPHCSISILPSTSLLNSVKLSSWLRSLVAKSLGCHPLIPGSNPSCSTWTFWFTSSSNFAMSLNSFQAQISNEITKNHIKARQYPVCLAS